MEKNRGVWVYDVETLKSCFTYTAINIDSEEVVKYVIHKDLNEIDKLIKHLDQCKGQIGFNIINFDYPIIHYIYKYVYKKHCILRPVEELISLIYNEAQRIIEEQNKKEFNTIVAIKQSEVLIPQLDLFKIWHFNNKARSTSLKALQIGMNYPNVMEMPISHTKEDITLEEVCDILEYNLNDVLSTYEFYKKSINKIELRKVLSKMYNLPMINWNDVKIGENIFLKLLSDDMGVNVWDLRKMRSNRLKIALNEVILDYIKYDNILLQKLLLDFKNTTIVETKNGFKNTLVIQGSKFEYGQGGLHQSIKSGIYTEDTDYQIIDIDVKSFYPNIAINNNFRPEHLGDSFSSIYSNIYKERTKISKNDPRNGAYKLMLNGCFGKAGDINSFLHDNKFLLSITVNGQLLLSILIDKFLKINNLTFIQCNTDGITIKFKRTDFNKIKSICKSWELLTGLELEHTDYSKMVIRDVNSYIGIYTDVNKEPKYKGAFEIDKDYHKDNSFRIIPIALSEYFIKGIPIEETIKKHNNIYDFCGRQKFTRESYGMIHRLSYDKLGNPIDLTEKQQKNVRYYISTNADVFYKYYDKGTNEIIHKNYKVTIFNNYIKKDSYDINYSFYIKECYKIIDLIEVKQLTMNF